MKTYTVTSPFRKIVKHRRDAAARAFIIEAYNVLAANGMLDTKAGHSFYNACKTMADDVNNGAYSYFAFSRPIPSTNGQCLAFVCA